MHSWKGCVWGEAVVNRMPSSVIGDSGGILDRELRVTKLS